MTDIKFEGTLLDISPCQLEYIASVLNKLGYNGVTATIENVGKAGDNYMANVKRIIVNEDGKPFSMIGKVASNVDVLRATMNTALAFRNEAVMYDEVLPRLTELEIAADIPEQERLRYAVCYGAFIEEPNEVILLEDLQVAGFSMLDRFKSLTDHEIRLSLKSLAKLHAVSYALKHRYPAEFSEDINKMINIFDSDTQNLDQMKLFFTLLEKDTQEIVGNDKYKRALQGTASMAFDHLQKIKVDADSKYGTIMHGDSWTNNIMFRFEGGKTVETCLIDYQISKCSVPPSDLHYLIFNCTDYKARAKHFHDWIDYYHSELDEYLNNFGLKASLVYPRDLLDADMKRHAKASLAQAIMLSSMLIRETEDAAKFKDNFDKELTNEGDMQAAIQKSLVSSLDDNSVSKYKARVEGVIDSFIYLGYLNV